MTEPWLVYLLIFGATFLVVQFGFQYSRNSRSDRRVAQRFAQIDQGLTPQRVDVIKRRDFLSKFAELRSTSLGSLVVQSGLRLTFAHCLGLLGVVAVPVYFSLFPIALRPLRFAASLALATALLYLFLRWRRAKRIREFSEQLPDIIDIVVRSLRAGHPLSVSLSLVAREIPAPGGPEFALAFDEVTYGRELSEALENLYHRVGYDDLKFMVTSISIAHQTGGNLSEILSRLSRLLRDRFKMKRKVRALSAEGRFSALFLSLMPFAMFGIINLISPDYYVSVWHEPILEIAAILCGILLMTGNFIMYKMVNFKY